jgi:Family of unknown function (DUF5871)
LYKRIFTLGKGLKKYIEISYMIHETNDSFPFSNLTLCKPVASTGGGFFIRYAFKEQPLYIQPPKCYIKQIHAKVGKKMYCDLVFQQENEPFLRWMEHLESQTQQHLYDNRQQWFQTDLEKEDIEQSFASPVKMYKSGKEYIVRTNIPSRAGISIMKIYDEDEKPIPLEEIVENTKVMVILEIQGIRSSSKSFQVDIEVKQMMVMKPEEIFNTCIFKKKVESATVPIASATVPIASATVPIASATVPIASATVPIEEEVDMSIETNKLDIPTTESIMMEFEPQIEENPLEEDSLREVELKLDETADTIALKERKELYYQMYEEARQKAKVARDLALSAYLEANQIKNKYMLDDVLNSSSDDSEEEEDDE